MPIAQADSTLAAIRKKVRRLTASASESVLTTYDLDQYINTFYSQDFPYGVKVDQMRAVYTFFTRPYVDRYPLDVNYNQGVRAPVYFEGIQGSYFKDRQQFYSLWPRFPTQFTFPSQTQNGTITAIAQPTNPTQITSPAHGLSTGQIIQISGVVGMTELNGNIYQITVINANVFSLDGVDNTTFGAYISGGTWIVTSQIYTFNIPGPFLSREVVLSGEGVNGSTITVNDDGNGNMMLMTANPVISVPAANTNPAIAGMYNRNTQPGDPGGPGQNNPLNIGSVDYVTGSITVTFANPPAVGSVLTLWVSQYNTGRPFSLLFWNNEFTVRPVPKVGYKVEVETFLTPTQFLEVTDSPILNQWWQYIAIGAAIKVLEDRNDVDGLASLVPLFDRQEALMLERQGVEELFTPNPTLFNSVTPVVGGVGGIGYY